MLSLVVFHCQGQSRLERLERGNLFRAQISVVGIVEHSLNYSTGCTGHSWWLSGGLLKWQEWRTGPSFPPYTLLYSTSSTFLVIFLTSLGEADSWIDSSKWHKDKVTIVLRVKEYGLFSPGWGMCWLYVCVKRPSIRFRPGPSGL